MKWRLVVSAAAIVTTPAHAQVRTDLHGEVRPRYELRDPGAPGEGVDEFTSMRVRLGVDAALEPGLSLYLEVQDVRLWGEETSPLFDYRADNLDLHQGYIRYEGQELDWLTATIGRMEVLFGGERLVGPVNWTQQGQSFDGVRADVTLPLADVALVAYRIGDETAPTVGADQELYGAYGTVRNVGAGDLDLYWLYDRIEGAVETDQHSIGARYVFSPSGDIEARVEGTLQKGTREGTDLTAFMVGARVGTTLLDDRAGITLWYDYLSGDDASSAETEVFSTLFATNHKFYGLADVFLNVPAHTAGSGLMDMAVKLSYQLTETVALAADAHSFRAANQRALSGSRFGEEIDLSASHRHSDHLTATAGFSYFWQDAPLGEVGRLTRDLAWSYLMLGASF